MYYSSRAQLFLLWIIGRRWSFCCEVSVGCSRGDRRRGKIEYGFTWGVDLCCNGGCFLGGWSFMISCILLSTWFLSSCWRLKAPYLGPIGYEQGCEGHSSPPKSQQSACFLCSKGSRRWQKLLSWVQLQSKPLPKAVPERYYASNCQLKHTWGQREESCWA